MRRAARQAVATSGVRTVLAAAAPGAPSLLLPGRRRAGGGERAAGALYWCTAMVRAVL